MLFTYGGFFVVWIIDVIRIACGLFTDDEGRRLTMFERV
jgi:hypothetical protein